MISIVILPIFFVFIIDAVPTTIEQNTSGTTSIFIRFIKAVPPKWKMLSTSRVSFMKVSVTKRFNAIPTMKPNTMAIRIQLFRFIYLISFIMLFISCFFICKCVITFYRAYISFIPHRLPL